MDGRGCFYEKMWAVLGSGRDVDGHMVAVLHFHIHIIPKKKGDGIDAWSAFQGARRKLEEVFALTMPALLI